MLKKTWDWAKPYFTWRNVNGEPVQLLITVTELNEIMSQP